LLNALLCTPSIARTADAMTASAAAMRSASPRSGGDTQPASRAAVRATTTCGIAASRGASWTAARRVGRRRAHGRSRCGGCGILRTSSPLCISTTRGDVDVDTAAVLPRLVVRDPPGDSATVSTSMSMPTI
jgi:hypothetical protein